MNHPILDDAPVNDPAPEAPAPAPPQRDLGMERMDRLELAMAELTNTVRDAATRLTQAPQQPPPRTSEEFLNDLATDPQGVIRRVAADTFRQAANETLNPAVMKVLDTASKQILSAHQQKVDMEFGEGTFDEIFRPQLEKDINQLRMAQPQAMADPATMEALVNRLYGGDNFPVLLERRKNLESSYKARGLSHYLPAGGVPRLRVGNPQEEVPDDVETFLRSVERSTGESIDRKHYAKLYHTGTESGPGRHRTTIVQYLKAVGADPDTLKMYGGERA